jgi:ATPase family AAA domain-containing protein 3A/B
LERKRIKDELAAREFYKEQEQKKAEEALRRQEQMRRQNIEYEAELRQKTELAKVKAETDGRIAQERQNKDIHLEAAKIEAEQFRETVPLLKLCIFGRYNDHLLRIVPGYGGHQGRW